MSASRSAGFFFSYKRASIRVKGFTHQGRADLGVCIPSPLDVGCLADRDFNLLKGLKHGDVIVTAAKQRHDFFGEERWQKIVRKNTTFAISIYVGARA